MKTTILPLKAISETLIYPILSALCFSLCFTSCTKIQDVKPGNANGSSIDDATADRRPNVVFILGDDIGHDIPNSFGGTSYQTPNIDAIGRNGIRFTSTYSSPLCSPSRVCIMTGKYNYRNYSVWGVLDPTQKTFGNLMQSAGYATYVAGKWQLDGGDTGVHNFGFQDYSLWNPIKDGVRIGDHYKNPTIYEYGQFLPNSYTDGKYGDDIFTDRILSFIDSNKTKKFFAYYPITLCHSPFSPTPDDPEFATWDTKGGNSDTSYFPSMVAYMDKLVGKITQRLIDDGVYNNTILIFVGDNGTPADIYSWWNGNLVQGGKSKSTSAGTNVPMFIQWPKKIVPGQVNDNLIDFSDFLPTFADIAGTTIPADYGTTDGVSFYKQLIGGRYTPRSWVFNHYQPNTNSGNDILLRWVQNHTYKLYDSSGLFYNIVLDPDEKSPLTTLTKTEKQTKRQFQTILDSEH